MTLQEEIMKALNVKPEIQPKEEIISRVTFLKNYLKESHAKGLCSWDKRRSGLNTRRQACAACC